jgi:hypothetical protein
LVYFWDKGVTSTCGTLGVHCVKGGITSRSQKNRLWHAVSTQKPINQSDHPSLRYKRKRDGLVISVSANWISVLVLATLDVGYIGIGQISAKILAYIGQNTMYRPNISQHDNIGIGIGGRYVGANISVTVSVSAKISDGNIYRYWYRLDPYRSNPTSSFFGLQFA